MMKTQSYKKGWVFTLTLVLVFTTLFGGFGSLGIKGVVGEVYAADQSIAIDSNTLTQDNTTWAWDAGTKTLTLKGINMSLNSGNGIYGIAITSSGINALNMVNVVVTGENVISGNTGLYYPSLTENAINFSGTGSLTINSDQNVSMYFRNTTIDFQSGVYNLSSQSTDNDNVATIAAGNSTCKFNGATVTIQASPYGQGYSDSFWNDPPKSNVYINSGIVTINTNATNLMTNNLVINGGTADFQIHRSDWNNILSKRNTINGGQVKLTGGLGFENTISNAAVEALVLTTLTLSGIPAPAAVSSLIASPELGYAYGTTDMKTDVNGVIYAYLPVGKTAATVVAGDNTYTGSITSNAGTLTLESSLTDISLTPVPVAYADRATAGTKVADLAATGTPTSGITYSLDGSGSDNSLFQIVGTQLQIKSGASLMAQSYTVKVKVTDGTLNNTYTKQITFTANVTAAPTYTMSASTLTAFASQTVGYGTASATQTVTITNNGNQPITLTQPTSTNYTTGTLSTTNLTVGGTATFTVQPKTGLAVGSYNETINITGSNSAATNVSAQFAVAAVPTYTMSASTLTAFASQTVGYGTAPATQTVTITNNGNQPITLTQPTSTNYTIGTLSTTNLTVGGTATFTVQPKTGLAVGSYNETINITGSNSAATNVSAQFAVAAVVTDIYTISADTALFNFVPKTTGYGLAPAAQMVTITNTGNQTITLTQPSTTNSSSNYTIGLLSDKTLDAGQTATFTLQPKTGLGVGTYNENIQIVGTESAATSVSVQFCVTSSGGSSGGSSGSNSPKATPVIGTNTGRVTGSQLKDAADAAKDGGTVTVKSNETSEVTLPTSGLDSLSGKNNSLTVVTENGTLTFNSKAVDAMGTQATATDIKVIVDDVVKTTLTEDQQTKVGDKTVYDLSVMSGGKLISSFHGGKVNVSIPYELKTGETAENLTVWYMADNESLTEINCTYDTKTKSVVFVVDHFSKYIIGYDELVGWENPFTDVKSSAWYYDAVAFVNMNGLMKGQTDTAFESQAAMTRGMFVTILGRMEGVDTSVYTNKNTFSDVKSNQYDTPYIAWASEKGIVTGIGEDKFAPNAAVTREQMAVMMTNYMKFKDQGPKGEWAIQLNYGDLDKVSSWAGEGVMFMTMKDLMNGMGNDTKGNLLFAPKSMSTRAQTAQVMMSLEELLK